MTTTPTDTDVMARVIAIVNGKGGAGKTSITANIAGQFARGGFRVLAIDLDLSGNLGLDLGYTGRDGDDGGRAIIDSVWSDSPLALITGVRPGLDVIAGGRHLEMLTALSFSPTAGEMNGGGVTGAFAARLAEIAENYDVIVLDCAPGNPVLQDIALACARYILIPTKTDAGGWDGLRGVGPRVARARETNPQLTYLGAVLFAHSVSAKRVLRNTRYRLEEVADRVPLFDSYIRHSETAAHDCRTRGQLAHELAVDATKNRSDRLQALRDRGAAGAAVTALPQSLSESADNLAGDYEQLAREILQRINAHEQTVPLSQTGR
jgi:chromosome partitioning protein